MSVAADSVDGEVSRHVGNRSRGRTAQSHHGAEARRRGARRLCSRLLRCRVGRDRERRRGRIAGLRGQPRLRHRGVRDDLGRRPDLGGHFNPAVSVAAAMGGRVPWSGVPAYVAVQLVGAVLGSTALFAVAKGYDGFVAKGNVGANSFGDAGSGIAWWAALPLELILTLVFVIVILGVTDARSQHPGLAPLAIGLTLTASTSWRSRLRGDRSTRPARSAPPCSPVRRPSGSWLFIVAPPLGGGLGGLVYPALFGHGAEPVAGSGLRLGTPRGAAAPGYPVPDAYQQQWNQAPGQAPWSQQPAAPAQQTVPPAQGWPQPGQAPYPPQQPWSARPPSSRPLRHLVRRRARARSPTTAAPRSVRSSSPPQQ